MYAQCSQTDKYADSYQAYGDEMYLLVSEYYNRFFTCPKTADILFKFEYNQIRHFIHNLYFDSVELNRSINVALDTAITQEDREKMPFNLAFVNFLSMYKDFISIDYCNGYVSIICIIKDKKLFNIKKELMYKCYERYDYQKSINLDQFVCFDNTGYPIGKNYEFEEYVFNKLYNIAKRYKKSKRIYINNYEFQQIVILKYNKKDGLSSLCIDDNIDLINDFYITDVKNFLDDLLTCNADIYEIIIPLVCYE